MRLFFLAVIEVIYAHKVAFDELNISPYAIDFTLLHATAIRFRVKK